MTENILQAYAKHNLLEFNGGNEQFAFLKEASEELVDEIITNQNVKEFALTAINPNTSIDNPRLQEVQEIIQEKWKLFSKDTKQTDIRRTTLRVVILNALDYLIDNDDKKAAIIWLSCQHVFRYILTSNKNEEKIIEQIIKKVGERYNTLAKRNFEITPPEFDFDLSKTSSVRLPINNERSSDTINKKLSDSSNIQTTQQTIRNNYNQQTNINIISTSNFNTWYEKFSLNLSTILEGLTTSERESIKKYLSSVDEEFKSIFQTITEEIPNQIQTSLHSLSNNNNLIWWKETLFSKSLEDSYRDLPDFVQVVAMAYDLANEINGYTPISVDFFLKETLLKVQAEDKKISIKDLSKELMNDKNIDFLAGILQEEELHADTAYGLLDFLNTIFYKKLDVDIATFMGIDGKKELTYRELLVWLFHDFQSFKLAQNG